MAETRNKCPCGGYKARFTEGNQKGEVCLSCHKTTFFGGGGRLPSEPHKVAEKSLLVSAKAISVGEEEFSEQWTDLHPDYPFAREYHFNLFRDWRLDFAWPDSKVAVEYEGFGHGRANMYEKDVDKYNALAYDDWLLFRVTKRIRTSDMPKFIRMVIKKVVEREGIVK